MTLTILGCEDTRLQVSASEPEDMSMQGCKQGCMNLRIQGCKDTKTQASTHKQKNMRTRGCNDINKSNIPNMNVTSRLHVGYYNLFHANLYTL